MAAKSKSVTGNPPVRPARELPDKLYFRIGDVAAILGVETYVLRFWESEFPQLKPGKGGTGQRLYRRKDVETALRIRALLYDEGYTIPGARQILKQEAAPALPTLVAAPSEPTLDAARHLRHIQSELRELASLLEDPPIPTPRRRKGLHIAERAPGLFEES